MAKTIFVGGFGPGISTAVAERFGREGFSVALVARNQERLDAGVGEGLLHMVSAVRQGRSTVVLISQTNPLATLNGATARELPEGVYLPEGARRPATLNMGEMFGGQLQIYSRVPAGELNVIGADFVEHLKTSGWQVSEPEPGETTWSVSAKRPGVEHTIALVRLRIAARKTCAIPSSRRGMSKRSEPSR